jgi:hypothetical protein
MYYDKLELRRGDVIVSKSGNVRCVIISIPGAIYNAKPCEHYIIRKIPDDLDSKNLTIEDIMLYNDVINSDKSVYEFPITSFYATKDEMIETFVYSFNINDI